MKLEMYTALESETRIELPGLEQPDDCFPLGGGAGVGGGEPAVKVLSPPTFLLF